MQLSERFVQTAVTVRGIMKRTEHAGAAQTGKTRSRMNGADNESEAVIFHAIHRAFQTEDSQPHPFENSHFGDLQGIVDRIVRESKEDGVRAVARIKTDKLGDLMESPQQVADISKALLEHGVSWLPKELVEMGKYVVAAMAVIALLNDPLRGLFVVTLLQRIQEQHFPVIGLLYGLGYVSLMTTEILRLQKGAPFVANPYVTLWAVKLGPKAASAIIRGYTALYDLFFLRGVQMSGSPQLHALVAPFFIYSTTWMFGEAGLNLFFQWLTPDRKRTIKRGMISGIRAARTIYANTPLPHPAWKKAIGVRRPPAD